MCSPALVGCHSTSLGILSTTVNWTLLVALLATNERSHNTEKLLRWSVSPTRFDCVGRFVFASAYAVVDSAPADDSGLCDDKSGWYLPRSNVANSSFSLKEGTPACSRRYRAQTASSVKKHLPGPRRTSDWKPAITSLTATGGSVGKYAPTNRTAPSVGGIRLRR